MNGAHRGLVWITGASSGIGRSTAKLLARRGWTVAASARNEKALKKLANRSDRIHSYPLDVADPVARREVYQGIRDQLGPVDILVNNAGFGTRGAVEDIEASELRNLFDVNVFAPLALARLVLPEMRRRREGRIIMVSSVVGRVSIPFSGAYSASKFAMEAFSDAMRVELRPWNIQVILVEPGPIATEFSRTARKLSLHRLQRDDSPYSAYYQDIAKRGMFRPGTYWGPATVAEAIRDACERPRPKVRYPVHPVATFLPLLAAHLPACIADKLLALKFGLDKQPES